MSRIGKMPVKLRKEVVVTVDGTCVCVKGPKGKLELKLRPEVICKVVKGGDEVLVECLEASRQGRAMHGLYRSLLANMVAGVSDGFKKVLLINGVGYRAEVKGKSLLLNLGYSTAIEYHIPEGLTVTTEANNKITVAGIDKAVVGQVASEIRGLRPPEPYKGKGVRYEDEVVRKKVGKAGVK